ncbi:hypothetical protein FAI40_03095 [Acetobacteraceae bacterium]|nr:hypothetical protein FAI40_03095 [Acetobacteraceae bacterium]
MPIHGSWHHFESAANEVYDPNLDPEKNPKIDDAMSEFMHVADVVQGKVAQNIQIYIDKYLDIKLKGSKATLEDREALSNTGFPNTCAVRMSYILNLNHYTIPHVPKITVSGKNFPETSKKMWFFFRVRDLLHWIRYQSHIGEPDMIFPNQEASIAETENYLRTNEKRGLICFSDIAGWDDATGHFSLYDGMYRDYPEGCYDHSYFDHAPRNILFWEIPD